MQTSPVFNDDGLSYCVTGGCLQNSIESIIHQSLTLDYFTSSYEMRCTLLVSIAGDEARTVQLLVRCGWHLSYETVWWVFSCMNLSDCLS